MMNKIKYQKSNIKMTNQNSKIFKRFWILLFGFYLVFGFCIFAIAQETAPPVAKEGQQEVKEELLPASLPGNVTLDFKDADINNVLRILSYKSGVNIVSTKDVTGLITVRLVDVPWEKALDIILKTYGFGYERQDNVIIVSPLGKLTEQKKAEMALAEVQPTVTEVFTLKFLNAADVKKTLEPQLSPRGKIAVLESTGPGGWEFGTTDIAKRKRVTEAKSGLSKTLVITDIPPVIEKIKKVIETIDVKPQQVLIETRIMEVSRDRLKDLGIDFGTGTTGAESTAVTGVSIDKGGTARDVRSTAGGHIVGGLVTPSVFGPKTTAITASSSAATGFNAGLEFVYKKLVGTQFEVILHALEEDVHTNTLSAPRIMTLNNQEASILVGTKYPILDSSTEEGVVTTALDYYQDIGIQLNVVPQISGEDFINMIVHPAVTSYTSTVGTNAYPIITTREAETQVLMKNGETIVIGGLLKDVKSKGKISIPILGNIPILGLLFQRRTTDIEKIDLLVFITAHIIKPGELTEEDMKKLTSVREIKIIEPKEKKEVKKKKGNRGYIYKEE
jgi:type IV pilus assembly protein PilQ